MGNTIKAASPQPPSGPSFLIALVIVSFGQDVE
jgi:hypothetical protein